MATYHCSVKHGNVGNARPHADYICREGKFGTAKMKEQLVYKESGNMPSFVLEDQQDYWLAADEFTRINGRTYEEFEVALPQELSDEDNLKLVKAFIAEEIGENNAYTFAIHSKPAANDNEQRQIHAHIMFSPKVQDGIERTREQFFKRYNAKEPGRGGAKNDTRFSTLQGKLEIARVRLNWEKKINRAYEEHGLEHRVSSKSLAVQYAEALINGDKDKAFVLDRLPQVHLGPKLTYTSLREAAKYVDQRKYYLEDAPKKVRHNFIARQEKKLAEEIIIKRRERILTLKENLEIKAQERSVRDEMAEKVLAEPVIERQDESSRDIEKQLATQLTLSRAEISAATKELQHFRQQKENYILSDQKIKELANDIYTKQETKRIRTQVTKCKEDMAALNNLKAEWSEKAKAGTLTPEQENIYKQQAKILQEAYAKRSEGLKERIEKMKQSLATEKAQKATQEIADSIRKRVDIARQRIVDRKERINNLRAQSFILNSSRASLIEMEKFAHEKNKLWNRAERNSLDIEKIKAIKNPHERLKLIRSKLVEMNYQQRGLEYKTSKLNRFMMKKEFAVNAAKSVYTHGQYKQYLKLGQEIEKLQKEYLLAPGKSELKEQLDSKLQKQQDMKVKLTDILSSAHAKASIERMVEARMEKNYVLEARKTVMAENVHEILRMKEELTEMREQASKDIALERQKDGLEQAASSLMDNIKEIANLPEAHASSGISVHLGDSSDLLLKDKTLKRTGYER
ncbi:MobA/MobL family protein [Selenomonas ruminantium]|uniref:MobA/MobL family protein n=1 Tax=Selenomonas ruminantium TaxID=971 RepID=A0A1I3H907_SELRU|nr:MobA/MobL family protein [Selenomonas ruminantium]SFI32215.1 MobA/MobL family protein [Selenomonas ruminantium]